MGRSLAERLRAHEQQKARLAEQEAKLKDAGRKARRVTNKIDLGLIGERGLRSYTIGRPMISLLIGLGCFVSRGTSKAQDFPTDAQVQAAFATAYNHLGLMEYCASKQYATAADVANSRKVVAVTVAGMTVSAAARAQEVAGHQGRILGKQLIGLMDPDNPAHPEMVPEGQVMSLADNARAQKTSERELCGQMAAQAAPLQ